MFPKRLVLPLVPMLVLAVAGTATRASDPPTVGEFVRQIAELRSLPADTPEAARDALGAAGVPIDLTSLDRTLTEGGVVDVMSALGIAVTTGHPDRAFDGDRLARFLVAMTPEIAPSTAADSTDTTGPYPRPNDRAADPATKGKGKKKGLPVSPSSPM